MVSELLRHSYVAAVIGNAGAHEGASTEAETVSPINQGAQNQNLNAVHPANNFDDPFYLHVTENPNLVLVLPLLSEKNYASWSVRDPKYSVWKRCSDIVCSWILKSLNSTITESVLYFEIAEDIWKTLQARYSQADPHKIAEVQNEIYKNKQGTLAINEYFTKCNALWEQLNAMRPIPICECTPRCSCNLMNKIQNDRHDDQIIRFLEGLNDEFETIKSGVLVMDPIPTLEKVLNMALKLERKLNGSVSHKNEILQSNTIQDNSSQNIDDQNFVAALNSHNKKFNANGGKNVPKYTYCNMLGHTIEKCYKKHGYPPGWVAGYKSINKQGQDNQQETSVSVNQVGDIGLSNDQFQRLISLLQNQNQGNQASTSAADTGPYGIMDGFAEEKGGLYLLRDPPTRRKTPYDEKAHSDERSSSQCNSVSLQLWHSRLGHYPIDKIHCLNGIKPKPTQLNKTHDFACDICHFAKHKRSSFPISVTKAENCFDLIHMDVWGPLATASPQGEHYFLTIVNDHSRFTWLHLMKHKSEVKTLFQNFYYYTEAQFSVKIKVIRTDNGSEFLMSNFLNEKGIVHQKSCVDTPQQNGIAERKHQHVLNVARALRFQASLPIEF
ncbi:PREDICTED: uncharacterized protein LOC109147051 [Ipomoea nil]|uniref:uncharacterized protein LOC109147051 n=1 Tax=Ipomoea nil TaxID=35883 RepID=UPI000900C010|nr:PREDICTED: uncharacterized protein LOC109147051 [Ipomoea nil]